MVDPKSLINLVESSKWPKKIMMKSIPDVEEIFYMNFRWKLVDRSNILQEMSRKGEQSIFYAFKNLFLKYENDSLLVCYNPIFSTQKVKVCVSESDAEQIFRELKSLKRKYDERVIIANFTSPRALISSGNGQKIEKMRKKFHEDRIFVEWIGPLLNRRDNVCLTDRGTADELSDHLYTGSSDSKYRGVKSLMKLDASTEMCVLKRNAHTQTDIRCINELFECIPPHDIEQVFAIDEKYTQERHLFDSFDVSIPLKEKHGNVEKTLQKGERLFDFLDKRSTKRVQYETVQIVNDRHDNMEGSSNTSRNVNPEMGLHPSQHSNSTNRVGLFERHAENVLNEMVEPMTASWSSHTLELCQQYPDECDRTITSFDILSPPSSTRESNESADSSDSEESEQTECSYDVIILENSSSDDSDERVGNYLQIS